MVAPQEPQLGTWSAQLKESIPLVIIIGSQMGRRSKPNQLDDIFLIRHIRKENLFFRDPNIVSGPLSDHVVSQPASKAVFNVPFWYSCPGKISFCVVLGLAYMVGK